MAARAAENARAQQMEQQMAQQPPVQPDQERMRPSGQLQLDENPPVGNKAASSIPNRPPKREAAKKSRLKGGDTNSEMN